jgi:hypothetical protein
MRGVLVYEVVVYIGRLMSFHYIVVVVGYTPGLFWTNMMYIFYLP